MALAECSEVHSAHYIACTLKGSLQQESGGRQDGKRWVWAINILLTSDFDVVLYTMYIRFL